MMEKVKSHPLTNVGTVLVIFLATIMFSNMSGLDGPIPKLGFDFGRLFDGAHELILVMLLYVLASLFKNKIVLLFVYGFELIRVAYFLSLGITVLKASMFTWASMYLWIGLIMLLSNYLLYMYVYEIIKLQATQTGSFIKGWKLAFFNGFKGYRKLLLIALLVYFMSVVIL